MNSPELNSTIDLLSSPPYPYLLGALLALIVIFVLLRRRQPRSVAAFSSEGGRVMVTRSAISELVHTSCAQLRQVAKPSIRIRLKGGRTHLEVRLKLASGGRLTEVAATLKDHLKLALEQNLGIENMGPIDIIVTGFKSGRLSKRQSKAQMDSEPEAENCFEEPVETPETEPEDPSWDSPKS